MNYYKIKRIIAFAVFLLGTILIDKFGPSMFSISLIVSGLMYIIWSLVEREING